jgi:hypothetical protein
MCVCVCVHACADLNSSQISCYADFANKFRERKQRESARARPGTTNRPRARARAREISPCRSFLSSFPSYTKHLKKKKRGSSKNGFANKGGFPKLLAARRARGGGGGGGGARLPMATGMRGVYCHVLHAMLLLRRRRRAEERASSRASSRAREEGANGWHPVITCMCFMRCYCACHRVKFKACPKTTRCHERSKNGVKRGQGSLLRLQL